MKKIILLLTFFCATASFANDNKKEEICINEEKEAVEYQYLAAAYIGGSSYYTEAARSWGCSRQTAIQCAIDLAKQRFGPNTVVYTTRILQRGNRCY